MCCEHAIFADHTIVCYMAMIVDLSMIADLYIAFEKGIPNRYMVSNPHLIPDYRTSDVYCIERDSFPRIKNLKPGATDYGTTSDMCVITDPAIPIYDTVRPDRDPVSYDHSVFYHNRFMNPTIFSDNRFKIVFLIKIGSFV